MNDDTATETAATVDLADAWDRLAGIAASMARLQGGPAAFAESVDSLDQYAAAALRADALRLAEVVCADPVVAERAAIVLDAMCAFDRWAAPELAGRFRSACRRLALVAVIRRHPRADRFRSLCSDLLGKRWTAKQLAFAKQLAAEVTG